MYWATSMSAFTLQLTCSADTSLFWPSVICGLNTLCCHLSFLECMCFTCKMCVWGCIWRPSVCCGFSDNFSADLLSVQLRMFDLNGDGKLGLSEMARWVCLQYCLSVFCMYMSKHLLKSANKVKPPLQALAGPGKFPAEVWGKITLKLILGIKSHQLLYSYLRLKSCNTVCREVVQFHIIGFTTGGLLAIKVLKGHMGHWRKCAFT